ncbi:hypothetical protein [Actinoplanes couchii]|uniref:Uncharacterized protein n=1 Tax=Actinoplanes couchii TaxID=403638 RepID=A0ABQ3XF41_9ACTN|nr:hypothetical protein [Actinoplanes couchii]MDR6321932.1 hypothetical protein [Actinoplanes couchii]GID57112.1 hypothetical protein Aco03nite_055160 [Actinoplanes couchii]
MDLHPDDHEELLNGNSTLEKWRRSDHAFEVAEELMRMHGGSVPMSELLWLGAEAWLPRQWRAGRAPEPIAAAVQVFNRWRKLEERRLERRNRPTDPA